MEQSAKIYVAGSRGMVGSAIVRELRDAGYSNLLLTTSEALDLRDQQAVTAFFTTEKPEYVFLAAAKVGGIHANDTYPADFLYENLMIQNNVIHSAHVNGVKKLLFLGSSCIYPKFAEQPIREDSLLTGKLEATNEAYAIAKIAGVEMCKFYRRQYGSNFISAMPTNLYGINDNFDLNNSHVLPALLRKFIEAKRNRADAVEIWGSGTPMREFLYVDDLAKACLFLMENYESEETINIGTGEDITIRDLALTIKKAVGFEGELTFDASKPDGTPRKLLDVNRINTLGWHHQTNLNDGIEKVYRWVSQNKIV